MICEEVRGELFRRKDQKYRDFQSPLIPTVPRDKFIGVRTPDLRALAKQLSARADVKSFLDDLPHEYFEENQLHAFLISRVKDFDACVREVERFLPFVDNWATTDQMNSAVLGKHKERLLPYIRKWLDSKEVYAVRFAVKMLMDHFLDEDFDPVYLAWVAAIRSEEYYINMMAAWYFATALAKRYEEAYPYLTGERLSSFVRKKAVQKALESYRVTEEHKAALRALKEKI